MDQEATTGIEPAFPEYKTGVLPLDDIAVLKLNLSKWIRRDSNPHQSG